MEREREFTTDDYLLISDSNVDFNGFAAIYEVVSTGRKVNVSNNGVKKPLEMKPKVQDVPIRTRYIGADGEIHAYMYKHPRQIYKNQNGKNEPVDGKGSYAITQGKVSIKDGQLVVGADRPGLIAYLDKHEWNASNPNRPKNSRALFRKVDMQAEEAALFNAYQARGLAVSSMDALLKRQSVDSMGDIRSFIQATRAKYPNLDGLPANNVESYQKAYIALSKFAHDHPIETNSILSLFLGGEKKEEISLWIRNMFAANILGYRPEIATGGVAVFTEDYIQAHKLEKDEIKFFSPECVPSKHPKGWDWMGQMYYWLYANWEKPELIAKRTKMDKARTVGQVTFGVDNPHSKTSKGAVWTEFHSKYGTMIVEIENHYKQNG